MKSHKVIPPRERTLTPPAHRRTLLLECKSEVVVICRCASTETGFVAKTKETVVFSFTVLKQRRHVSCFAFLTEFTGNSAISSASKCFQVLQLVKKHACTILHKFLEFSCDSDSWWLMPVFFLYAYLRHVEAASLVETAGKCSKVLFQSRNLMQIDGYFDKGYSLSVVIVISANWLRLVQP